MYSERDFYGTRYTKRFSSWLRSGAIRKMHHANKVQERLEKPDTTFVSEVEESEDGNTTRWANHSKEKSHTYSRPPRINLSPTSELQALIVDEVLQIQIVEFSATQEDIDCRMAQQEQRILQKPETNRTIPENQWIHKRQQV